MGSNTNHHRVGNPNTRHSIHNHERHKISSIPLLQHHVNDIGKIEGMSITNIIYVFLSGVAILAFLLSILALAGFIDYRDIPIAAIKEKLVVNTAKNDDTTTLIQNDTLKFKTASPSETDGASISIDNTSNSIDLNSTGINFNSNVLSIPKSNNTSDSIQVRKNVNFNNFTLDNITNVKSSSLTVTNGPSITTTGIEMNSSSISGLTSISGTNITISDANAISGVNSSITGTGNIYMGNILGNTFTNEFEIQPISATTYTLVVSKLNYNEVLSLTSFEYTLPSAIQGAKLSYLQKNDLGTLSGNFYFKCGSDDNFEQNLLIYGNKYIKNTSTSNNTLSFTQATANSDFLKAGTLINFWCTAANKWFLEVIPPSDSSVTSLSEFSFTNS